MSEQVIMIPVSQYERMLRSYDDAIHRLEELKQQLDNVTKENTLREPGSSCRG